MIDSLNRVRGVRRLPLFPLPLVLFPGATVPLHIFEPRYRQMLADITASGDRLFGLSYYDASEAAGDWPEVGHVGCVAEVTEVETLPDGRSNIVTQGVVRYRVESYAETNDPYLVAEVSFFEDEPEDEALLAARAHEVLELFARIAQSVRTINDGRAALPDLPEAEPERLSFLVASAIELDAEVKLAMLELRSTSERLVRLRNLLERAVENYEERARVHKLAKGNGHAGRKVNAE